MNLPENQICSDCPERQPRWASLIKPPPGSPPGTIVIGAFCCLECSGSHRRLGVHISFVRSITLDQWKETEVRSMENGGNEKVNAIFEAKLDPYRAQTIKPTTHANGQTRERFIRDKYERRKYYDREVLRRYNEGELGNDSESESESESDDSDDDDQGNYNDARRRSRKNGTVRAPSEVARLRAEKRRQHQGGGGRTTPTAQARSTGRSQQPAPRRVVPPEVDLLDFGRLTAHEAPGHGPPPSPPSAAPSPTLDLFRHVKQGQNLNHMTGGGGGGRASPQNVQNTHSEQQQQGRMTKDDPFAMFHTPSSSTQQQQQQQHQQQQSFGGRTSNNSSSNTAYGNGNSNPAMMQNAMTNGQMANNFASNPNNNAMMMMMMNNHQGNMMPNGVASGTNNPMMVNSMMNPNNSANPMLQNQMMMNVMNPGMSYPMNMHNGMIQKQQQQGVNPQQQQQEMMSAAPMGGTPSNMNVMGGMSTGNAGASLMNNRSGQVVADSGNTAGDCTVDPFETFGDFRSF